MIKNEHQYRITRKLVRELQDALALLPSDKRFRSLEPLARKAHVGSLRRQLNQLEQEIEEYESLKSGKFDFAQFTAIKNASALLIKMRIARGIGQEDLAKKLNLKKQQVQQYEATGYASASLARVIEVIDALTPAGLDSDDIGQKAQLTPRKKSTKRRLAARGKKQRRSATA